ncbi:integrator complex subunit 7-like [Gigantopelta aegis]|uniref:integrator complex subunit 7-like n=1 Tax=Gigantopelta aegis TaxID=1735272 RepID=UPI001B8883CB|nr:integrator complex subunit 7-like [Gigantopelta aegis]
MSASIGSVFNDIAEIKNYTYINEGLHSGRIDAQCEAIVKFPKLFEKYPFPILINSALLKLADVFRTGNNFIRLCILKVTQQSEKHLDKILNVDEFIRRIVTVLHSNDPVARAIALRTLGSIACIIPDRKNVHHSIAVSLDSHDPVEVEGAIFAAEKFSDQSKTFAASICGKIAKMISAIATPVDMKLKLIPILRHMHHDITTATKARNVCLSLLESFPAERFVTLTLTTMSQLAADSLLDLEKQVLLLVTYIETDPRHSVKMVALRELKILAKKGPHLWQEDVVEAVSKFVLHIPSVKLKVCGVEVLVAICSSVAVQLVTFTADSKLFAVCQQYCYHDNLTLATRTVHLLSQLAKSQNCPIDLVGDAVSAIQTHIILLTGEESKTLQRELKLCLRCVIELCHLKPALGSSFVDTISYLLPTTRDLKAEILSEALAAIGSQNSQALECAVPIITSCLENCLESNEFISQNFQLNLCTLVYQAARGGKIPCEIHELVVTCAGHADHWVAYKMVRQAMRYGQYQIAGDIVKLLTQKVASEHLYYWLLGLNHVCSAEARLRQTREDNSNLLQCVSESLELYQKGLASLRAGCTPIFPLKFQCSYVELRISLLQVHSQLILACNTLRTSPPPAIATALASNNGQEGTRLSGIIKQLEKTLELYEEVSHKISEVYWSSFDADCQSLHNVDILRQSCDSLKAAVTSIVSTMQTGASSQGERQLWTGGGEVIDKGVSVEAALQSLSSGLNEVMNTSTATVDVTSKIDFITHSAQALIKSIHSYPRYFFQTLQSTAVKLAVSPQQNANMEPILVHAETHLTLKVEGVIQHGGRPAFRHVHTVCISVSSNIQSRSTVVPTNTKVNEITTQFLSQAVEPHNDYFSVNFLLAFPVLGIHSVIIEAAVLDSSGATWKTGPRTSLTIKSFDESLQRQQQQARYQARAGSSMQKTAV